jgi:hypothetical protein
MTDQWQPIETAPKNKQVILYHPPVRRQRPPYDVVLGETTRVDFVGSWPARLATHWLPLPPPPKDSTNA